MFRGQIVSSIYLLLLVTFATAEVTESNLRSLLSNEEWRSIMGSSHADPDFALAHQVPVHRSNNRDDETEGTNHTIAFYANSWNRTFEFTLRPSPKFLAPNFKFVARWTNRTKTLSHTLENNCFYIADTAALSMCSGIMGIIADGVEYFILYPLPRRLLSNSFNTHVIISLSPVDRPMENNVNSLDRECTNRLLSSDKCYDNMEKKVVSKRLKRNIISSDSPVFVETAVFIDRDLYQHMKSNYPVDTERELARFVLAMINAVQLLYHDPSLGRPVNFLLKRLEVLHEEPAGLVRPHDIDRFLSSFCSWQRTQNPPDDSDPAHWDHALILTGLDLYVVSKHGKISSQVVGLAPVAGMCTATSSCTVNEGRHFESVYVVAHEIGHNLGMRHDGPTAENDCDPSSYIMSPTLGSGKITWSSCSQRYLQKFLETTQSRCLLDHGSSAGQLDHNAEGTLPGERFDADQQCMLKYGKESSHSIQQPLDEICRDLHCQRERYTWTSHPALEGTLCGQNMWCRGGKCVARGDAESHRTGAMSAAMRVDGGWSPWKSLGECSSPCLYGEEGRLRSGSTGIIIASRRCNSPRPEGGGQHCIGPSRRYRACSASQCLNVPRMTVKEFAAQVCGRAKEVDLDLTGIGIQRTTTNPEEACMVWCQKREGGTKSRGWTYPDGTVCHMKRTRHWRPSYCINGRCEEFVCDTRDESAFVNSADMCSRVDSQKDTTTRWVSASGCHYNCMDPGSGVRLVVSKGKHSRSSIQLCQPDRMGCTRLKTPFSHASTICAKYRERVRRLSGLGTQIFPASEDPDRPCRVACQDETVSHRFYLVNGEEGWFPFGTDCSMKASNKKAYCISGKCLEFGSDGTPVSQSEFTLPLLSRSKRTVQAANNRVTTKLRQYDLDLIVLQLNSTLNGKSARDSTSPQASHTSGIDLNNPIHIATDSVEPTNPRGNDILVIY